MSITRSSFFSFVLILMLLLLLVVVLLLQFINKRYHFKNVVLKRLVLLKKEVKNLETFDGDCKSGFPLGVRGLRNFTI